MARILAAVTLLSTLFGLAQALTIPACPAPSTSSITCIYGSSVANVQSGGSCKCKCSGSQTNTFYGSASYFNSPTSAGCSPAACLSTVGLSVCPPNSGYTNFTAEYLTNAQLNAGGDYAQFNDYGGSIYGITPQLGVGTICGVLQFTCTAAAVAQTRCQTSQINEVITLYSHFNTTSYGTAATACSHYSALASAFATGISSIYFCNTNNCNTATALPPPSSASSFKPAAALIAAIVALAM